MIPSHRITFVGDYISYIFADTFPVDAASPLPGTRSAAPGSWTVTDTGNQMSILNTYLTCTTDNPGTNFDTHKLIDAATVARIAGRALFFVHRNGNTQDSICSAGFNANSTLGNVGHTHSLIMSYNGSNTIDVGYKVATAPLAIDITTTVEQANIDYPYVIVLRGTGAFYFRWSNAIAANEWQLWFVETFQTTSPLTMFVAFWRQKANNDDAFKYMRLRDLTGPFTSDFGIATQNVASPISATTYIGEFDSITDMTVATATALDVCECRYRFLDANNYWTMYFDAAGAFKVDSVVSGTPTNRVNVAGVMALGHTVTMRVRCVGTKHDFWTLEGTTWTKRGSQVSATTAMDTSVTTVPVKGANDTITNLQIFPIRSALYEQLSML